MGKRIYFTDEEKKAAIQKSKKCWNANNPEYYANYYLTPKGRAKTLLSNYRRKDKITNRGECTLTEDFIIEHIFSQPCAHCGRSDWTKIGCNRLDNSLPHTPDNVEPCCWDCNNKLGNKEKSKPVYQYTKNGELIKIWSSTNECGRNGYSQECVSLCCNGKHKTHKGYLWSYIPL